MLRSIYTIQLLIFNMIFNMQCVLFRLTIQCQIKCIPYGRKQKTIISNLNFLITINQVQKCITNHQFHRLIKHFWSKLIKINCFSSQLIAILARKWSDVARKFEKCFRFQRQFISRNFSIAKLLSLSRELRLRRSVRLQTALCGNRPRV